MQTEIKRNIRPSLQLPGKGGLYRIFFKRLMDFMSFFLDFQIVIKTIIKAFKREGVTVIDQAPLQDLDVERRISFDFKRASDYRSGNI